MGASSQLKLVAISITEFHFDFVDCTGAEGLLYKAKALRTEGTEPAHLC